MATLVLTAVGTAIGGPLGGALGAFVGRQADLAIAGGGSREGPRVKELSVTTSSYGQPIPRILGRMRSAGTVVWSTDLVENTTKEGGGKGRPSATTYSYSASFAVALSSTPIARIGRIWADGNLLRGSEGDLKVPGEMRFYRGFGDDPIDPLIAADRGVHAPGFRDCAYVVFEDLQLGEFGNRIPALTFEIFSPEDARVSLRDLVPGSENGAYDAHLPDTRGFSDEGGPIAASLSTIDRVVPLTCIVRDGRLALTSRTSMPATVPILSERLGWGDEGGKRLRHSRRSNDREREPLALRYYDEQRDYQPGVQRALGIRPGGRERMIDLPAAMNADGARRLANANAQRARWQGETLTWRTGELDPNIGPGDVVRAPQTTGYWRITSREWFDRGIEYTLVRLSPENGPTVAGDGGDANTPADIAVPPTLLKAFEVPPGDTNDPAKPIIFAAASAKSRGWRGATLYSEQVGTLVDLGPARKRRAIIGTLAEPIEPSPGLFLETDASIELALAGPDLALASTDMAGLANGANRLLVGAEILQFMYAEARDAGRWRVTGLLRGRAGTEPEAMAGHGAGETCVLLDDRLTSLDPDFVPSEASTRIAAIGLGDAEPVHEALANVGLSRRPPMPVAAKRRMLADDSWELSWVRRARGQWRWSDAGETPLVEERETYIVGYGAVEAPHVTWSVTGARYVLTSHDRHQLRTLHGPAPLWVRQAGTYASSPALKLAELL